jgi:hypothetical protein
MKGVFIDRRGTRHNSNGRRFPTHGHDAWGIARSALVSSRVKEPLQLLR